MVHHDGVDGPEEEADEEDRNCAADERGHEPDDERERDREEEVEEDRAVLADLCAGVSSWSGRRAQAKGGSGEKRERGEGRGENGRTFLLSGRRTCRRGDLGYPRKSLEGPGSGLSGLPLPNMGGPRGP